MTVKPVQRKLQDPHNFGKLMDAMQNSRRVFTDKMKKLREGVQPGSQASMAHYVNDNIEVESHSALVCELFIIEKLMARVPG